MVGLRIRSQSPALKVSLTVGFGVGRPCAPSNLMYLSCRTESHGLDLFEDQKKSELVPPDTEPVREAGGGGLCTQAHGDPWAESVRKHVASRQISAFRDHFCKMYLSLFSHALVREFLF